MKSKKSTRAPAQQFIKNLLPSQKRSQLTIFIILAILIIGFVVLFFTFRGTLQKEKPPFPEIASIQNFVEECIYESGQGALYFIGQHGGYYLPSKFSTPLGIPYYIKDNQNLILAKENIEVELSKYVDGALPLCIGNFKSSQAAEKFHGNFKAKIIGFTIILRK